MVHNVIHFSLYKGVFLPLYLRSILSTLFVLIPIPARLFSVQSVLRKKKWRSIRSRWPTPSLRWTVRSPPSPKKRFSMLCSLSPLSSQFADLFVRPLPTIYTYKHLFHYQRTKKDIF
jgi:hypothetical protein